MFQKSMLTFMILLLIKLPGLATATAAAFQEPKQIQVYEESYYYHFQGVESKGNGPLLTYKQQAFLPVEDVASILGLTLSQQGADLHLDGAPTVNSSVTVEGALPKDATIAAEQLRINPKIGAQASVMLEDDAALPVFSKNANQRLYPSSTLKIMTALLAIERGQLQELVTVSPRAAAVPHDSSKAGLVPGDRLTLEQLLYAMMLPSGNDAAVAIAELIAGSEQQFVQLMNTRARELGMTRTNFVNSHGYHHPNQYTTAADLALVAKEAAASPLFMKIVGAPSYYASYRGPNGAAKAKTWRNSNSLIRTDSPYFTATVTGGKTGYTSASRYNLVSFASSNDHDYVTVILRGERNQRYVDTRNLLQSAYTKRAHLNGAKKRINVTPFPGRLFFNGRELTNEVQLFNENGKTFVSTDVLALISTHISRVKRSDSQQMKAALDQQLLTFDRVGPVIRNGRMLVPVRSFFEEAGLQLKWDAAAKRIEGRAPGTEIVMTLNSKQAYVNGQLVSLDVPATIENGRTLVPLRFISEALEAKVDWGRGRVLYFY
ncbi:stalk domain-containing protein [Alkalihalobacillus oceani]|uniref:Stalk domain-containing protein n=1 Tax=Halalkalibacter oceani TaxID=1653776 RepID=A0A9X2DWC6_9BACI|nr:stalk domain-containing protein [Halalkalibacter oceani]MCM3716428.1 stalk domain-containing protein [Halalkalibacter oceani]